jgi:hypothetical protein
MDYYPPLSSRAHLLVSSLISSLMLPTVLALSLPLNRYKSFAFLLSSLLYFRRHPSILPVQLIKWRSVWPAWHFYNSPSWSSDPTRGGFLGDLMNLQLKAFGRGSRRLLKLGGVGDWPSQLGR